MASTTYEHFSGYGETVTKRHQFASIGNMVRNAGQLPQPFWVLPVAAARVVPPTALQGLDRQQMTAAIKSAPLGRVDRKIALLRYVERLPLPDIAAQMHYSRTAIGYRLKGIEKMLDV
jgi:hypothetical protein